MGKPRATPRWPRCGSAEDADRAHARAGANAPRHRLAPFAPALVGMPGAPRPPTEFPALVRHAPRCSADRLERRPQQHGWRTARGKHQSAVPARPDAGKQREAAPMRGRLAGRTDASGRACPSPPAAMAPSRRCDVTDRDGASHSSRRQLAAPRHGDGKRDRDLRGAGAAACRRLRPRPCRPHGGRYCRGA